MSILLMSPSFFFPLFLVFREIEQYLVHVKSRVNFADDDAVNKRWREEEVREKGGRERGKFC